MRSIGSLPDEVLIHVLSLLTHLEDLKAASLVCKRWHSLLSDEKYAGSLL